MFAGSLALFLCRFLIPRPVGASNNGDGKRVLCGMGIPWTAGPSDYAKFSYFKPASGCDTDYFMVQSLGARIASWIGHDVLGDDASLNLVVLGIGSSIIAAAAIAFVVLGLPLSIRYRLIIAGALLLVLADSAFFGYFASVLGEGPAFLGIVLMIGGMLLMSRAGKWRYAGIAITIIGGLIGVNAKVQTLTILPLLLIALLFIRPPKGTGLRRWAGPLVVGIVVTGGTVLVQQPLRQGMPGEDSAEINAFNVIFMSIVDGEHNTRADLAALGLPASFAQYAHNGWWHPNPARTDPLYPRYQDQITRANVAQYYLKHPLRTLEVLQHAASDLLRARPHYLTSFDKGSGYPPDAQEYRVPVVSLLTLQLVPLGLFLIVPLWIATFVAGLRRKHGNPAMRVVVPFLLAIAISQFLIAGLGDGIENIKHQVIALFSTLIAVVMAVANLLPRDAEPITAPGEPALGHSSTSGRGITR